MAFYLFHSSCMKKIFWTTVFWVVIIFLFRSFVRLFDKPLGREVGSWFGKCQCQQICLTWSENSWLTQQLDTIQTQLDLINQKLQSESETPLQEQDSLFQTKTPTKVALYYFNQIEDQKLAPEQQINTSSLLPVYRIFPATNNLLVDTINELIKGKLSASEKAKWFMTEFPNKDFALLSADIDDDGILTLEFTEVPGFTDGGSARMLILSSLIEKTALQFPAVKKVVFTPETLFQP